MVHGHVHADVHAHAGIHGCRRRRRWCGRSSTGFIVATGSVGHSTGTTITADIVATTALEERVAYVRCLDLGLLVLVLLVLRVHLAMIVGVRRNEHLVRMHCVGE